MYYFTIRRWLLLMMVMVGSVIFNFFFFIFIYFVGSSCVFSLFLFRLGINKKINKHTLRLSGTRVVFVGVFLFSWVVKGKCRTEIVWENCCSSIHEGDEKCGRKIVEQNIYEKNLYLIRVAKLGIF